MIRSFNIDVIASIQRDHVIDQTLLDVIDDVSDPKNAEKPGRLAYAAGGVDKLSTLKSKIQNLRILDNLG